MKKLTVRLPEFLAAAIEKEAEQRNISRSEVVRQRLLRASGTARKPTSATGGIGDLIGSVYGLPQDVSARKKRYLRATGYGR